MAKIVNARIVIDERTGRKRIMFQRCLVLKGGEVTTLRDEEDQWKNRKKRIIIICSKRRRSDNVMKSKLMEKLENNNNNNRTIEVEIACNVISTLFEKKEKRQNITR